MRKFDRRAPDEVSAASSSSGVRPLAASVRAVIALVNPGPWWTVATPTSPETRAYPSAIDTAAVSCRAVTTATPAASMARVTTKLPLPTTVNT